MTLGVVIERRTSNHPWQDHFWLPAGVIVGAPPTARWRLLAEGDGWQRFHAATLELVLHRSETEAYRVNLSNETPVLYVVLRPDEREVENDIAVHMVTASPFEAQDYLDSGEEIVEPVEMPPGIIAWVQGYIDRHHVDERFLKRKRRPHNPDGGAFAPEPRVMPKGTGIG
ncbi:hypothetical protein OCH7691_02664 [Oceanibacterium hippocampi]|uniref:Molybdopterin-guanine dinucleotide biosynthesis protein A n=2 Tax=Oceanibacterium hippocampi TaxID=745714 RepID=A0A1Y5TF69_9PROT|nr:hypothetical protein OCH7691_02664 [Oceanibacterium hippocampi]